MGDPDFVQVPVSALTSKGYAKKVRGGISLDHAKTADQVKAGENLMSAHESSETTHFSIMDAEGNAVASTQTINGWMGSSVVVPGTGILLNNQMDDFSAKPGASNIYGAIGGQPNSIAPKKTPLSSMSPTIVLKSGVPVMAVGAPGGTRIISCVLQTILNYLEFKKPLYVSVEAIRFHHQWKPDEISVDAPGFSASTEHALTQMGYKIRTAPNAVFCRVMAVSREGNLLRGASDPRDAGSSLAE
jgi:gamma-glutamyltranspeptidase / glutathione hydrolase